MKRKMVVVLSLILMLNMMPACFVHAEAASGIDPAENAWDVTEAEIQGSTISKTFENPLYEDAGIESDLRTTKNALLSVKQDAKYFDDPINGDISSYILEQLLERNSTISIRFPSDGVNDESRIESYFTSTFDNYGPGSGDYLRYNISSWSYEAYLEPTEDGSAIVNATYYIDFLTTAEQEEKVNQKLKEISEELKFNEKDEYECAFAAYKYITSHVAYDYEHLNDDNYNLKYTAYAALFDGKAVCQGYAVLFYRLTNDYGLSSRVITGKTNNGEEHAWNIVMLGSSYYNVDCTWDTGKKSGTYDYFLKCNESFTDHIRDAEFSDDYFNEYYPMAQEDYTTRPDFEDSEVYTSGYYAYVLDGTGNALITAYTGNEKEITVPSEVEGHPVYAIDKKVFGEECIAETITLSEGIKGWYDNGDSAFYYCPNLTTVNLPSTVGVHDGSPYDIIAHNSRFYACLNLKNINIAGNNPYLTVVDNVLFTKDMSTLIYYPTGATATSYTVPEGVTLIDDNAFMFQEHLTSVILPESLDMIGWFSFHSARKLSSVVIPDNCTYIGEWAFTYTALETIHIPEKVEDIIAPAFYTPTLKEITVSENNPFYYTVNGALFSKKTYYDDTWIKLEAYPAKGGAKSFIIPDGTNVIATHAFSDCISLEEVSIPASVTSIEDYAFWECNKLKDVYYAGSSEDWDKIDIWDYNEKIQNVYHGIIEDDASTPSADPGNQGTDASMPATDPGNQGTDASIPTTDPGIQGTDASMPATDPGNQGTDASTPAANVQNENAAYIADHIGTPKITLSRTGFTYKYKVRKVNNKKKAVPTVQKPSVKSVKLNGKTISAENYIVTWSNKKSSAIGEYTVTVTLKGQYSGKATAAYRINPKAVKLNKVKGAKKKFTATWKKLSNNDIKYKAITGYQIRYATKADFSNAKIIKAGSMKAVRKDVKKLKAKTKYYVQLRTYKKAGGKTFCSGWSKTKIVKTK